MYTRFDITLQLGNHICQTAVWEHDIDAAWDAARLMSVERFGVQGRVMSVTTNPKYLKKPERPFPSSFRERA